LVAPISAIIRGKNKPFHTGTADERGAGMDARGKTTHGAVVQGGTMTRRAGILVVVSIGALLTACNDATPPAQSPVSAQPSGAAAASAASAAEFGAAGMAPRFEVDPFWPKPLPNHWLLGSTIGVSVDSRDHVWIIHRQQSLNADTEASAGVNNPRDACCMAAPNVIELDAQGNVAGSWGGPGVGYDWPTSNHGITVDHMDNVWIGGNDLKDAHVLKFSRSGQFLLQLGKPEQNQGSNDPVNFWRVAKISIDAEANEAYVADGYGNKRVVVIDMNTGERKRYWGAYGNRPDDTDLGLYDPAAPPAQQFRNPVHCAEPSRDGFVYVCDRVNDRIQVFRKDGTYVSELRVAPETRGAGSVWDIAFSHDPGQSYIYLADGLNERVYIIHRQSMQILTSFGGGGRQPGQFFGVHSIAVDSQGNIYTTETYEGKRVQKFVFRGLAAIPGESQGPLWPR
jgi:DNA-binding beta-propeller fold protein YncE